jgi:short subunit dehydrogenase-like uncharacterized protein
MVIAVHGASGYTGRLVVAGLARAGIDMVLVGRDAGRLRDAAAAAGADGAEVRTAGLDAPGELAAALRGRAAVINCAGPFVRWGEPVVRAAIAAGTDYLDISGEQPYIQRVFDTFAVPAERGGVRVVPMVNDGGFLADLLAGLAAERAGGAEEIVVAHRATGGGTMSRGSGRSVLANRDQFVGGGLVYSDGRWRADVPAARTEITFPGDAGPSPVARPAMPEVATIPRHVRARHVEGVTDAELVAGIAALTPDLVEGLPERPSAESRRTGRFVLVAEATGANGRVRGVVEGGDTYAATAVVAVEAARRLAAGGAAPGVLAPSRAFDAAEFLDALGPYGIRWSVGEPG